ncbi:MAG TPA: peptide chain release factor N(5)-glutamine methyltransferase [Candidatus Sumerlaeota bacterium]|nr:peptide chain release factor N(5)-glutamine methyltransferase [Candidatus Sumerlaeota bacterium]HOR29610.1 peptide chain release factor N(5)-glutamine methyltransferase [Candidatus Sumerlaeota bacterium]
MPHDDSSSLTARRALELGVQRLQAAGIESARLDMSLLLAEALHTDRLGLLTDLDRPLKEAERLRAREYLARRIRREPVAYILGRRDFYGLTFELTRDVLIPRPETEHLVERALAWLADHRGDRPAPLVADVGVGSGAIAVAVARNDTAVRVIGVDSSAAALAVAGRNAQRHGVADRIELRHGSLLEPVAETLDAILSNPPYVAETERAQLPPEVADWEPAEALFSGRSGLDAIAELIRQAPDRLRPGGLLLIELGAGQADTARMLGGMQLNLECVAVHRDYAGHPRVLEARKR